MEKIKNYLKDFVGSKKFDSTIYWLGIVVAVIIIFQAGVFVGFHKANFSYKWGDNYQKFFEARGKGGERGDNFEKIFGKGNKNDKPGMFGKIPLMPMDNLMGAHGATGKIIDVKLPSIIISGTDNIEKAVLIASSTLIRQFREEVGPEVLKINDNVVVIGTPNENAEIIATMIRIIPSEIAVPINNATTTNR